MERTGLSKAGLKNQLIDTGTSKRITALRFLLAAFVVFIHNRLTVEYAAYYNLAFSEPVFVTWIKYVVCLELGGAAVPLFFLFAGYLQFKKDDRYPILLRKRAKSLLIPYVVWTLIGVLAFFIGHSIPRLASFFQNENNIVREWSFLDWINIFWMHSDENALHTPLVYQLWFVRDLIVLVIATPVLKFLAKKAPFATGIAVILCFLNGLTLGFGTALFFYMAGFFFAEYDIDFFKISDKITWPEMLVLLFFVAVADIAFSDAVALHGFGTVIPCLFFCKLSSWIIKKERLYKAAEYLAGLSFFLYAIHAPFIINLFNKISYRIMPLHGLWCLVQFVVPSVLCVALGTGIGIALKKICPPLFALLNGGRK